MAATSRTPEELVANLMVYLTGYGRDRHDNLENIIAYDDWQQAAKRELDRRATEVITSVDSDTLIAIAQGEIFVDRVARDVLKLLQAERARCDNEHQS